MSTDLQTITLSTPGKDIESYLSCVHAIPAPPTMHARLCSPCRNPQDKTRRRRPTRADDVIQSHAKGVQRLGDPRSLHCSQLPADSHSHSSCSGFCPIRMPWLHVCSDPIHVCSNSSTACARA